MNSSLRAREVRLPKDFKVETQQEKGRTVFRFDPALELPFAADELREKYEKDNQVDAFRMRALRVDDFRAGAFAILKKAIPAYLGSDGFFKPNLGNPDSAVNYKTERLDVGHFEEDRPVSLLVFKLPSEESSQLKEHGKVCRIPTIDSGTVEGHVMIHAHIPTDDKKNYIYNFDIVGPILTGLLLDTGIDMAVDERLRTGRNFSYPLQHIKISDPRLEMIKEAVRLAELIRGFFVENRAVLQKVAKIVEDASKAANFIKDMITFPYHKFVMGCDRFRKERAPDLPQPPGIDNLLQHLDVEIAGILAPANDKLVTLRAFFPPESRRILEYATTERTGDRLEDCFYC